ncbi:hypothetical protein EHO59_15210 [Leptospira semungkisensis]|uniref:Lamin tail domain-containing protein n=1 Tax=Leptospira semungkisensis TaxID=2484985 RepID=A0A4R9FLY9_9LEPT|nr:hypothetical protein [Leptospira semungkisensis]TGJ99224.1 hypothetical protein EHO59_15210 [Leptospira semungkisensis]
MNKSIPFFLFCFFGFISVCKGGSAKESIWSEEASAVSFQYDPLYSGLHSNSISEIQESDGTTCVQTGEDPNLLLQICLHDNDAHSKENLHRSFESWKKEELVPESSLVLRDGSSARIGTYPKNDLLKWIQTADFALVGEREFDVGAKENFWTRKDFHSRTHQKSFSIFHFQNEEILLVLPARGEKEIYFAFRFTSKGFQEKIRAKILLINRAALEECSLSIPVITEIFGETDSPIGRWIEIYNPNPFPICEEGLGIELFGTRIALPKTTGWISPFETRVYGESSSKLERFPLSGIRWGDLKKVGNLYLFSKQTSGSFPLPGGGYLFGEEYISWTNLGFSECKEDETICMSPGRQDRNSIPSNKLPVCALNSIELEEVNPIGWKEGSILWADWKYLDLLYTGLEECDPSFLQIQWGNIQEPVSFSGAWKPGQIFTIGSLPFLISSPNFSYRNLKAGKLGDPISLLDRSSGMRKILWDGVWKTKLGSPDRIILEKTDGSVASICFENGGPKIHAKINASRASALSLQIKDSNLNSPNSIEDANLRTSPGRRACTNSVLTNKAMFSEVSWMGSYQGTNPIAKDRFLEFVNKQGNPNAGLLRIVSGSGAVTSILFPLDPDSLTLLSAGASTCFPETSFWKDPAFSLPTSGKNIVRLYDPDSGEVWDEFLYDSSGPGINDTKNKIRKSAYSKEEQGVRTWKVSSYAGKPFRDPTCALTDAHPSELE